MSSYLLKNRHGNYYTRVPFPHALCQLGYPQEIRLSLLTKDRHEATLRNLVAAHGLKQLIGKLVLDLDYCPSQDGHSIQALPSYLRCRSSGYQHPWSLCK